MILKEITREAYKALENDVKKLPLVQSALYSGIGSDYFWDDHFYVVHMNEKPIGLVIIKHYKALAGLVHGVTLDCGPVWMDGHGSADDINAFASLFNAHYPRRIGRKRRWIPISSLTPPSSWIRRDEGHQTLWLNLTPPLDALHQNLKKNWRNALTKAEKSALTVSWDSDLDALPFMLKTYDLDKKRRGYGGLSVSSLETLIRRCYKTQNCVIGRALYDGDCVAYVIILTHGQSATYMAGWSHQKGRAHNAHHLLLWNALDVLKQKGINYFDLGGINEENSKGVAQFKMGMGGDIVRGSGLYT